MDGRHSFPQLGTTSDRLIRWAHDPRAYSLPDDRHAQMAGGMNFVTIPQANDDGTSRGFDPHKPSDVVQINPDYPDDRVVIDMRKLTDGNHNVKQVLATSPSIVNTSREERAEILTSVYARLAGSSPPPEAHPPVYDPPPQATNVSRPTVQPGTVWNHQPLSYPGVGTPSPSFPFTETPMLPIPPLPPVSSAINPPMPQAAPAAAPVSPGPLLPPVAAAPAPMMVAPAVQPQVQAAPGMDPAMHAFLSRLGETVGGLHNVMGGVVQAVNTMSSRVQALEAGRQEQPRIQAEPPKVGYQPPPSPHQANGSAAYPREGTYEPAAPAVQPTATQKVFTATEVCTSLRLTYVDSPFAQKPKQEVVFEFADSGKFNSRWHSVAINKHCVALGFDSRYDGGEQFIPRVMGQTPITLHLPAQKKLLRVLSLGLTHSDGVLDYIILPIDGESPDMESPPE